MSPMSAGRWSIAAACAGAFMAAAVSIAQESSEWAARRASMVERQIQARGVQDPRVLEALRRVPRHRFVPESYQSNAYADSPLPIGHGQTISQPYIVAYMTEALELQPSHRVLEIGTGSGYQAAVLAELAAEVYTIEIVPELAARSRQVLGALGYENVHVRTGNGYLGWPEAAPFDRVILTAAPDELPSTLVDQLAPGGILIAPVGRDVQVITVVRRTDEGVVTEQTLPVRFVPMVGPPGP